MGTKEMLAACGLTAERIRALTAGMKIKPALKTKYAEPGAGFDFRTGEVEENRVAPICMDGQAMRSEIEYNG